MDLSQQLEAALIQAYQEAKEKYGYNPSRFIGMLNDKGAVKTAIELVHKPGMPEGLTKLWEHSALELSVEAIILNEAWNELFEEETLRIAQDKLLSLGFVVSKQNASVNQHQEWNGEELLAAVSAYFSMLNKEERGEKYNKSEINNKLRENELHNRTKGSVEFRMQNISAVLNEMGLAWIQGYKPQINVGEKVRAKIKAIIFDNRFLEQEDFEPTPSNIDLDKKVGRLLQKKLNGRPTGTEKPKRVDSKSTQVYRDPAIKAWILQQAEGICELCNQAGPFTTKSGLPFLEVHHAKLLAKGGSDTVENAAALCPNCHRSLHYAENKHELLATLYAKVSRLNEEVNG